MLACQRLTPINKIQYTDTIFHMQVCRLCGKVGGNSNPFKWNQNLAKSKPRLAIKSINQANSFKQCYLSLLFPVAQVVVNGLYTPCCPCGISPILVLLYNFIMAVNGLHTLCCPCGMPHLRIEYYISPQGCYCMVSHVYYFCSRNYGIVINHLIQNWKMY